MVIILQTNPFLNIHTTLYLLHKSYPRPLSLFPNQVLLLLPFTCAQIPPLCFKLPHAK